MQSTVPHFLLNLLAFGPEQQGFDEAVVMVDCITAYETLRQALAQQIRFAISKLEVISDIFPDIHRDIQRDQTLTAPHRCTSQQL